MDEVTWRTCDRTAEIRGTEKIRFVPSCGEPELARSRAGQAILEGETFRLE